MDTSKLVAAALATAVLGAGAHAPGQTTTTAPASAPARPTGAALAIPELLERLSREGYRDFGEVERKSDRLYKVSARNAQGRSLEMDVDARTAEVLASEGDDDD